ncbi:hypothetical protein DYB32_000144, partial [Aphanomyces invadans]
AKKAQDFQVDRHGDANQAVSTLECVQFPLRGGAVHPIGVWTCDRRDLLPSQRHDLHVHFVQPMNRPVLRRRCQWLQPSAADDQTNADRPLVNIHLGASFPAQSAVPTTHLVQGKVAYYHYLQQGVQDKGWGCAYRSLQTLASWLWLNQYTDVPVPTHREIQDILFKLGDKPPRFVGSRGWIGTVEVGLVLDERFHVSCRTIYCASGRDLPRHAPTLAEHFLIHGSPVMMGKAMRGLRSVDVSAMMRRWGIACVHDRGCGDGTDRRRERPARHVVAGVGSALQRRRRGRAGFANQGAAGKSHVSSSLTCIRLWPWKGTRHCPWVGGMHRPSLRRAFTTFACRSGRCILCS